MLLSPIPPAPLSRLQTPRAYVRNATAANLGKWNIKLNRLLTAVELTGYLNIVGDSHARCSGGKTYANSLGARLAADFRARLGIAVSDHPFGNPGTTAAATTYDPRTTFTIASGTAWGVWQDLLGGKTFRSTVVGDKMIYNPSAITPTSFDTDNLLWFQDTAGNGGGGSMTITVDGGATNFTTPTSGGSVASQTISQSGAARLQSTLITVPYGQHTIEVTNASGNIQLWGHEEYTAAKPTLFIRTMGSSGYTTANMVANNIPNRFWENTVLQAQAQILIAGSNDAMNGVATATYSTNLATLLGALTTLGSASIIGVAWPPCAAAQTAYATQQTYLDLFRSGLGATSVLYDLNQRLLDMGGQEPFSAATGGLWDDLIHLNARGLLDMEAGIMATLLSQVV
jgi:hypothetical protein